MGLEWQLTAKENLILYGNIFGMKSEELEKRCNEILELTEMYENSSKFISQLSAGMRQKLTIARGLLIDKPIMYLDEPSVSLDVNSAIKFRKIIKKFTLENKKTTIITSHVPDDLAICDRLMFLYKGQVIAIGTKNELYEPYKNKQVLDLKCSYFEDEYIGEIKSISGVQNATAYSNESGKDYRIIKVSIENDQQLVNKIVDLLLSKNVLLLNMNINDISLQEIYEHYIDAMTSKNHIEMQNSAGGESAYGKS
jgi:ABC-2 type transport system ATP-binding protein